MNIKALLNRRRIDALEKERRTTTRVLNAEYRRLGNLRHHYDCVLSAGGYSTYYVNCLCDDIARANDSIHALKETIVNLDARIKALRG